jgi:hypothetical protein
MKAAQALVDWLATDPTGAGDADYLIMGDLNSYAREDPVTAITVGPDDTANTPDDYTNLVAKYLGTYAYSYVFDGQAGYLDHAASTSLTGQVTGVAEWHINADEPDVLDYDTTFKPPAQDALYEPNAFRTSDHDPTTVGLDPLNYAFAGFFNPVDPRPTLNSMKSGAAVPVKFSLGGDQGLAILAAGFPLSTKIACDSSEPQDQIEQTVTAGASSLRYDAASGQYIYTWKTDKAWAGTCRRFTLMLADGTSHSADFKFTK